MPIKSPANWMLDFFSKNNFAFPIYNGFWTKKKSYWRKIEMKVSRKPKSILWFSFSFVSFISGRCSHFIPLGNISHTFLCDWSLFLLRKNEGDLGNKIIMFRRYSSKAFFVVFRIHKMGILASGRSSRLSRPYHFKFFKGQILLGPFLNALIHIIIQILGIFFSTFQFIRFNNNSSKFYIEVYSSRILKLIFHHSVCDKFDQSF